MKPAIYYLLGGVAALALSYIGCGWDIILVGLIAGAVWMIFVDRWLA